MTVWTGRVEHIASGRVLTFTSRAQLLAFLTAILTPDARTDAEAGDSQEGTRAPPLPRRTQEKTPPAGLERSQP
jgi:hypothetical protein